MPWRAPVIKVISPASRQQRSPRLIVGARHFFESIIMSDIVFSNDRKILKVDLLVYGPSKIGKTTSCLTLPADKVLVLNTETKGIVPLRNAEPPYPVINVRDWNHVFEIHANILDGVYDAELGYKPSVIFFDGLTGLDRLCKEHILNIERKALMLERSKNKSDKPQNMYAEILTQEDYGLLGNRMENTIDAFLRIPRHIIFTCLETWAEDQNDGKRYITPLLSGRMRLQSPSFFNTVLYMKDTAGGRVFQSYNTNTIIAGDSSSSLSPEEPADFGVIFKKILSNKEVKQNGN